jgi:putative transposase
MKKSRFTESQIVSILQKYENGTKVSELCREYGIAEQTFYNWKAKYGGMSVNELKRVKELEEENSRLKRIVANQALEIDAVKYVLEKKYGGLPKS